MSGERNALRFRENLCTSRGGGTGGVHVRTPSSAALQRSFPLSLRGVGKTASRERLKDSEKANQTFNERETKKMRLRVNVNPFASSYAAHVENFSADNSQNREKLHCQ
jgi:hypothetical protein